MWPCPIRLLLFLSPTFPFRFGSRVNITQGSTLLHILSQIWWKGLDKNAVSNAVIALLTLYSLFIYLITWLNLYCIQYVVMFSKVLLVSHLDLAQQRFQICLINVIQSKTWTVSRPKLVSFQKWSEIHEQGWRVWSQALH